MHVAARVVLHMRKSRRRHPEAASLLNRESKDGKEPMGATTSQSKPEDAMQQHTRLTEDRKQKKLVDPRQTQVGACAAGKGQAVEEPEEQGVVLQL